MSDKGLSRIIPTQVHHAHRPFAPSGWEIAALSYMAAVWLSVIGSLVLGFSISFHAGLGGLFLGSPLLFIGAPLTVVALTLVARLHGPQASHLGRQMMDAALTLFFLFGVLLIVIGIIGFFAAFTDNGFGPIIDDLFLHLADIAFGVLGIVWALGEIAALGNLPANDAAPAGATVVPGPPVTPPAAAFYPPPTTPPSPIPPSGPPTSTMPAVPPPAPPAAPGA
jgi:hypothetical protein